MRPASCISAFLLAVLLQAAPCSVASYAASSSAASRPSTATQRLAERCDADGPLAQSVWGFCAVNLKGDTLVWLNPERRMVPASNLKLITTGAALLALGPGYRFRTTFATDGVVAGSTSAVADLSKSFPGSGRPSAAGSSAGSISPESDLSQNLLSAGGENLPAAVLRGNLYILGGGDPMIGDIFPYLPKEDETFGRWYKILSDNKISSIEGDIVGEGSWFSAPIPHPDWGTEDLESRDGVVPCGLTWRGRMGDTIPDGPFSAALHYLQWLSAPASYTGAENRSAASDTSAVPRIGVSGIAREWTSSDPSPDSLTVLGSIESLSLAELARIANCQSDNFIAETFIKTMGKTGRGDDSYKSSAEAMHRALSPLGLMSASGQMRFADGSGLSRKNYVSPAFMTAFLRAMTRSRVWQVFLDSLPYAGEKKTTLEKRLPKAPAALKRRIRMKSGSMNGVRCFSGYILPADGRKENTIVFSILTNNAVAQGSQVYQTIDAMVESLAKENE